MKEVIKGKELKQTILKASNILCDAALSTLGPSGNNVIINTSDLSPYITNDGVTIAKSIESDDIKINTVLEILKEASLKTDEKVGDGTTTTLVLLKHLLEESYKEIEKGYDKILLKKDLFNSLNEVITKIDLEKKKPTKKDLFSIASISANDKELGKFLSNVFYQMKSKNLIKVEEGYEKEIYYKIKKGYNLEIDNISPLYFKKNSAINLKDTYILVLKGYLSSLESINEIINEGVNGKNIVILADDFEEALKEEVILYYLNYNKNIFLFKIPDYGSRKESIIDDISLISSCNIKNITYEEVSLKDLGKVDNIIIQNDEIIIINDNENVSKKVDELKEKLNKTNSTYEKDFIIERISKLEGKVATIYVCGITKTEIREKIMRIEDALYALEMSKKGVSMGEGITYLKISNEIQNRVMKKVLHKPFDIIMKNASIDKKIKKEIINSNYKLVYDFENNKLAKTNILDPAEVLKEAIRNAVSIAAMLITTNYLVINENIKKIDEL